MKISCIKINSKALLFLTLVLGSFVFVSKTQAAGNYTNTVSADTNINFNTSMIYLGIGNDGKMDSFTLQVKNLSSTPTSDQLLYQAYFQVYCDAAYTTVESVNNNWCGNGAALTFHTTEGVTIVDGSFNQITFTHFEPSYMRDDVYYQAYVGPGQVTENGITWIGANYEFMGEEDTPYNLVAASWSTSFYDIELNYMGPVGSVFDYSNHLPCVTIPVDATGYISHFDIETYIYDDQMTLKVDDFLYTYLGTTQYEAVDVMEGTAISSCYAYTKTVSLDPGHYQMVGFIYDETGRTLAMSPSYTFVVTPGATTEFPASYTTPWVEDMYSACGPSSFSIAGVDIGMHLCRMLFYTVVPDGGFSNYFSGKLTEVKTALDSQAPFYYFSDLLEAQQEIDDSSTSGFALNLDTPVISDLTIPIIPENNTLFDSYKTSVFPWITTILWLTFGAYLFFRGYRIFKSA